jgi:hypothetical protein
VLGRFEPGVVLLARGLLPVHFLKEGEQLVLNQGGIGLGAADFVLEGGVFLVRAHGVELDGELRDLLLFGLQFQLFPVDFGSSGARVVGLRLGARVKFVEPELAFAESLRQGALSPLQRLDAVI